MVFSGLHSPPLLANKSFINNQATLVLDPWVAPCLLLEAAVVKIGSFVYPLMIATQALLLVNKR